MYHMYHIYIYHDYVSYASWSRGLTPRNSWAIEATFTSRGWATGECWMRLPRFNSFRDHVIRSSENISEHVCTCATYITRRCAKHIAVCPYLNARCTYRSLWVLKSSSYVLIFWQLWSMDWLLNLKTWGRHCLQFLQSYPSHGWCHGFYLLDMLL